MNKVFQEAVDSKDIVTIRLFLSNELLLDPRGNSFDEMLDYAEPRCPDLFEDVDSSFNVIEDSRLWSQTYLNDVKNELDTHFIKRLLVHYKEVAFEVLKDKSTKLNDQENEQFRLKKNTLKKKKIACGALLVGGTTLTIAGLSLSKGLMVKTGAVVIMAGGYFMFSILKDLTHGNK